MPTSGRVRAIGLMSGTSMDGIDVALIETDGEAVVARGPSMGFPYDADLRARVIAELEPAKSILHRQDRPDGLKALEDDLTDRNADAVARFAAGQGIDLGSVDVIGFHGQTVLHRPDHALTVQLGDGERLAKALGRPVVYDLRAADMAAGGEGAPLAPAYHAALAAGPLADLSGDGPVVFVNIGGISNVTFIEPGHDPIAFDSGPGNNLLDQWVEQEAGLAYDEDGAIAARGRVIPALAQTYLTSAFFVHPAPKSLDRADFIAPAKEAGSLQDVARTLCHVTAQAIARSVEHFPKAPMLWVVCGGGRRHPVIMADLAAAVAERGGRVIAAEEAGIAGDAVEAEAWAYLAVRSLKGLPITWPTTTGCHAPTTGGVLVEP
ncbi:anhydro-N-acetylmuramic acid kinase [Consotaella aegiceratis]|uniref:anhydro-N-acetylmuramic acid kinase n=1 Tax=Consotaella aegiceratis TaxID=3097961 RepID=UPI002F41822D